MTSRASRSVAHHAMGRLQAVLDHWRFRARRADYFEYLGALMDGMQGRRTLKEIFEIDARRYGLESVRGRMSLRWAHAYQSSGGDLYVTWLGSFPLAELTLIKAAQSFGNAPLIGTLNDLAAALRLVRQARDILVATLCSALLGFAILIAMVLTVPLFTVPRLQETFYMVTPEQYGSLTVSLVAFARIVQSFWLFVLVLFLGGAGLFLWSLPNFSGPLRQYLERYTFWRIYRCVNALRLLAVLAIVLTREGAGSTQLRTALSMQKAGASPWQNWHIDAMLARIDVGLIGADTFDTGLLDRELFWFLGDMVTARGVAAGLIATRQRLKDQVLKTVARQALILRWCIVLFCVGCLLALGLWHYAVIDELRRSLMLFYASQ